MWLYVPTTLPSSPSAPAAADSTWDSDSLSRTLARFVTWSGKLSPRGVWSRRCASGSWMTRLSGLIWPPSTARRGVASWIASWQAGRARRTARQDAVSVLAISVTCGPTFTALSRRYVLDCSLARMSQGSLLTLTGSPDPLETSRTLATALRQSSSRLRMSARVTSVSARSSSPNWRTPEAPGDGGTRNRQASRGEGHQVTIAEQAEHWCTPTSLTDATQRAWPTPDANTINDGESLETWEARRAEQLALARNGNGMGVPLAIASRSFHPDPATSPAGAPSSTATRASRRRLNPRFVSWLMGWPLLGDTGSDCSATASSHYKQRYAFCALWAGRRLT